jgi:hypothetical protein
MSDARRSTPVADGLDLVVHRPLMVAAPLLRFGLAPGDRPLVLEGEEIAAGTTLARRYRDVHVEVFPRPEGSLRASPAPGAWWPGTEARRARGRGRRGTPPGEILYDVGDRWHVAVGEHEEALDAPADGRIEHVRPGSGLSLRAAGAGIPGVAAVGGPSRGRLVTFPPDADLRTGALDVGLAGAIVAVGARVDAETLTRCRATGLRGVVVANLSDKERRDFLASEARQRAGYHGLAPFAVLILDGAVRRPIATPVRSLLESIDGREVAVVGDPPMLVFDASGVALPEIPADLVRIASGPAAGREGTWVGDLGIRRFRAGVRLRAGLVRLDDGSEVAVPLADLERYA